MIRNNRGFGILEVILLCGFLVFLVIPAFSAITEKVYLKYSVHKICELADTSVMSSFLSIDTGEFSGGHLAFTDIDTTKERVKTLIEMNMQENMEILDFEMSYHSAGGICAMDSSSDYDFIHLEMKVALERLGGRAPVEFRVHRDIEYPYDR